MNVLKRSSVGTIVAFLMEGLFFRAVFFFAGAFRFAAAFFFAGAFFTAAFFLAVALVFFAMSEDCGKAGTRAQLQKKFNLSSNCPNASHV